MESRRTNCKRHLGHPWFGVLLGHKVPVHLQGTSNYPVALFYTQNSLLQLRLFRLIDHRMPLSLYQPVESVMRKKPVEKTVRNATKGRANIVWCAIFPLYRRQTVCEACAGKKSSCTHLHCVHTRVFRPAAALKTTLTARHIPKTVDKPTHD